LKFSEYIQYDGIGLRDLVRSGEVRASEIAETALSAIAALNPVLNGVLEVWPEAAQKDRADLSGAPFAGVPFLIKDISLQCKGRRNEMGSRLAQGLVAQSSSFLMDRFDGAGLVTLGRTATPELGHGCTTEAVVNGPTRNPWNLDRMAGGSSGGSAAAVASGMVPLAHANDGAGSIRIPAACCGLVGLKPSRGRVSAGPGVAEGLLGMGAELGLTKTVRDTALLLDIASPPTPGDPFVILQPDRSYSEVLLEPCRPLKIAYTATPWYDAPIDWEVQDAVTRTATLCESLGHNVIEASPSFDYSIMREACITAWASGMSMWVDMIAETTGREPGPDTLEAATYAMYRHGRTLSAQDLLQAMNGMNTVTRAIGGFFEGFDILLTPATAKVAQPLGTFNQNAPVENHEQWFDRKAVFPPFLAAFNVTGQPAMSLPLYQSEENLPIGIQAVGQFGREDILLQLAAQLEDALPWRDRLIEMQTGLK